MNTLGKTLVKGAGILGATLALNACGGSGNSAHEEKPGNSQKINVSTFAQDSAKAIGLIESQIRSQAGGFTDSINPETGAKIKNGSTPSDIEMEIQTEQDPNATTKTVTIGNESVSFTNSHPNITAKYENTDCTIQVGGMENTNPYQLQYTDTNTSISSPNGDIPKVTANNGEINLSEESPYTSSVVQKCYSELQEYLITLSK